MMNMTPFQCGIFFMGNNTLEANETTIPQKNSHKEK